jgi:hypothetical protein
MHDPFDGGKNPPNNTGKKGKGEKKEKTGEMPTCL